jgi:uncharacterized DUF497 family protein
MKFDWDSAKARANLAKHEVSFDEAEERLFLIGRTRLGRLVVVWHVEEGSVIRIIGAREPTRTERRNYEEAL